jgi:hypothetical protein
VWNSREAVAVRRLFLLCVAHRQTRSPFRFAACPVQSPLHRRFPTSLGPTPTVAGNTKHIPACQRGGIGPLRAADRIAISGGKPPQTPVCRLGAVCHASDATTKHLLHPPQLSVVPLPMVIAVSKPVPATDVRCWSRRNRSKAPIAADNTHSKL